MAKSAKAGNELLSDEARASDDDSGGGRPDCAARPTRLCDARASVSALRCDAF